MCVGHTPTLSGIVKMLMLFAPKTSIQTSQLRQRPTTCAIQSEIQSGVVLRPNVIQMAGALAAPLAPIAAALVPRAARRRSPDAGEAGSGRLSAADSSFDGGMPLWDRCWSSGGPSGEFGAPGGRCAVGHI